MKAIIAIDPGYDEMGWALYDQDMPRPLDSGKLLFVGDTRQKRFTSIWRQLATMTMRLPNGDQARFKLVCMGATVVIELPSAITYSRSDKYGKPLNVDSMQKLHQAIGAIALYATGENAMVDFVPVPEYLGSGKAALKPATVKAMAMTLCLKKAHEFGADEAHALVLGDYYRRIGWRVDRTPVPALPRRIR